MDWHWTSRAVYFKRNGVINTIVTTLHVVPAASLVRVGSILKKQLHSLQIITTGSLEESGLATFEAVDIRMPSL